MRESGDEHTPQREPGGSAVPDDDSWADEEDEREPVEVHSDCRCGECCRMIIEVDLDDARREPRIAERGSPIYAPAEFTESGKPELEGYLLNDEKNGEACTFLDTNTNLCSIYPT